MNYRHSFHAGNHADVLKHVVLLELLRLLTVKDKPLAYLESHAGAGVYTLDEGGSGDVEPEWRQGIGRLSASEPGVPVAVRRYLDAVRACNDGKRRWTRYPGSPALAASALRSQDRLRLCESQPEVAQTLNQTVAAADPRVAVLQEDGYQQALKALLPPMERRGLVLVDPPYEARLEEFRRIVPALTEALRRFATGVYAVWYPVKRATELAPPLRRLAMLPAKTVLTVELHVRAPDSPLRLNGSGVAIVNPPWPFADQVPDWLPWLSERLAAGRGAGWRCQWLKSETR